MALVRCLCDKQSCIFNDNEHCVSPEMPRWITPDVIVFEDIDGRSCHTANDTYSVCDRFVKKG